MVDTLNQTLYGGASNIPSNPYTNMSTAPKTTPAPAVVSPKDAINDSTKIQETIDNKTKGQTDISSVKTGLVTTYDETGNMIITGGKLPNGTVYQEFIPKSSPKYVPNPSDTEKQKLANEKKAEETNNANLAAAASGTMPASTTNNMPITAGNTITPVPAGIDPQTTSGQIDWYSQDPDSFEKWAREQGGSQVDIDDIAYRASAMQLNDLNKEYNSKLSQLVMGTYPLTPDQEGALSALQKRWELVIDSQMRANETYKNAFGMASARRGGEYDPMGAAGDATRAFQIGINAIASEQAAMTEALYNMRKGFDDSNFTKVTKAYDAMVKNEENITKNLKDMHDASVAAQDKAIAAAKDIRDFSYKVSQDKITNTLASDKFTWEQKMDMINSEINKSTLSETKRHNLAEEAQKAYEFQLQHQTGLDPERVSELSNMLNLTNEVLGKKGDFAAISTLPGWINPYTLAPGSPFKYTKKQIDQLRAFTSLDNRKKLKGSGSISDFESTMLQDASTALESQLSPEATAAEIRKIRAAISFSLGLPANVKIVDNGNVVGVGQATKKEVEDSIYKGYNVDFVDDKEVTVSGVDEFVKKNPQYADNISKMYEIPGADDLSVYNNLKERGLLK